MCLCGQPDRVAFQQGVGGHDLGVKGGSLCKLLKVKGLCGIQRARGEAKECEGRTRQVRGSKGRFQFGQMGCR